MNSRIAVLVTVLLIAAQDSGAPEKKKQPSAIEKVLRTMFPSAKPKVTPKKKPKPEPAQPRKRSPSAPTQSKIFVPVDSEWMARYWEQEAAWDYYIPEDDQIKFTDGKYFVPIVVFRHYEDMFNSRRRATPTPAPD